MIASATSTLLPLNDDMTQNAGKARIPVRNAAMPKTLRRPCTSERWPNTGMKNSMTIDASVTASSEIVRGTFSTVAGKPHAGLASLNPTTGALDPFINVQFAGHHNDSGTGAQGWVGPWDIDVTPNGATMVVIGNFKTANGLLRDQAAMLDLTGSSAQVAPWATSRYSTYCYNWAFDSYVRGVSFSPDGSYFVINATGGGNGTLCDTTARFATNLTDTNAQPTWVDWTGGDTV